MLTVATTWSRSASTLITVLVVVELFRGDLAGAASARPGLAVHRHSSSPMPSSTSPSPSRSVPVTKSRVEDHRRPPRVPSKRSPASICCTDKTTVTEDQLISPPPVPFSRATVEDIVFTAALASHPPDQRCHRPGQCVSGIDGAAATRPIPARRRFVPFDPSEQTFERGDLAGPDGHVPGKAPADRLDLCGFSTKPQ